MVGRRQGLATVLLLVAACKAGGPKAPPGAPLPANLLRPYEGELRILRHAGDQASVKVKVQERLGGDCDVAVRVRSAAFEKRTASLSLETIGLPNVNGQDAKCKRLQPQVQLAITGFPAEPAASDVLAQVDERLQTPEAYLRAKGGKFDLPPGKAPMETASELVDANAQERALARATTAWPKLLLSVNPVSRAPSKDVRQQGFVQFEALVGTDGRLYRPLLKESVGDANEAAVLGALPFWRFAPARRGDAVVGARVPLRLVLHIY